MLFRCSLPTAMSISRSEIFRKKKEESTENEKVNFRSGIRCSLTTAMGISRSEIFRKKKKKSTEN